MNFNQLYDLSALEVFRIIAGEFSAVSDADVEKALLFTQLFIDPEIYGQAANVALALMTAHIMALPGGANGGYSTSTSRVTSKKEGDLAISYASLSGDSSWLGQSTYGQLLQLLKKRLGLGLAMMVRKPVVWPDGIVGGFEDGR